MSQVGVFQRALPARGDLRQGAREALGAREQLVVAAAAEFDGGAVIELGRGSDDEVLARAAAFVRTVAQVTGRYQRPLEYADLRHTDGYAVRLKGVTTHVPEPTTRKR